MKRGFMKQTKPSTTEKPKRSKAQPTETDTPEQDKHRQGLATTQTSPDERARENRENQGK
jgi:hypothetical protein